ncbi:hypothetical protein [Pseudomonas oryzihabitans]|uniref:hypothetical protein n=1 Tax=Pseudomonas oryzihabitans TaxID=47885 RepID=UPI002894F779|nr:hypothetical protein [Pseudomonas oryzihabitans]MDT3720330.1 hypothetical protein [Pseudomonas oryzihabitans]
MRTDPTQGLGPELSLEQAIDRDCRDFRGGLTAVCAIMGKPYDSFQKRLSISHPENHLSVRDFEQFLELVRGPAVSRSLDRLQGRISYQPVPVESLGDALKAMADKCSQESLFFSSLRDGVADSVWKPHEVARLEAHGEDLIRTIKGIMSGARRAMVEDDL